MFGWSACCFSRREGGSLASSEASGGLHLFVAFVTEKAQFYSSVVQLHEIATLPCAHVFRGSPGAWFAGNCRQHGLSASPASPAVPLALSCEQNGLL